MTTEAERLATAFDTGDYTIYEIKDAAALLRQQAAKIEQMKSNAPPEGSIRAVRDYRCTCGKVVSFPIDSEITKANAEIACLRAEIEEWRFANKADELCRSVDKANTLLRQALEALAKYTTPGVLGGRVPIDAELVAAIKQHLGEV